MEAQNDIKRRNYILLVWVLVLVNIVIISRWLADVSLILAVGVIVIGVTGTAVLTFWSYPRSRKSLPDWIPPIVKKTMGDFYPVAQQILNEMVVAKTGPVIDMAKSDLANNTGWLCESGRKFGHEVLNGLNEIKKRLFWSPGVSLSDELFQLQKSVEDRIATVSDFLDNIDVFAARIVDEMDLVVSRCLKEILVRLGSQQEIALKYLEELLYSQMEDWDAEEEKPVPQIDRIGRQFELFMESPVNQAVDRLRAELYSAVQDLTSKMVGRLQRETLAQVNSVKQLAAQVQRILTYSRGPREKLTSALELLRQIEQDVSDVMKTLAWQDIVLEKKWSETKRKLIEDAELLVSQLGDEERARVRERLETALSGQDESGWRARFPQVFALLVAAEKKYWDYENGLAPKQDMIRSVLQWTAAVDEMASLMISVSSEVLSYRRAVRDEVREGKHGDLFEAVKAALSLELPGLMRYVNGFYPNGFYAFCLNPGIGYQPHKSSNAAWMLYLRMLFEGKKPEEERDTCLLIGLLLASDAVKSHYLQLIDKGDTDDAVENDLRNIRDAGLRTVMLLRKSNDK